MSENHCIVMVIENFFTCENTICNLCRFYVNWCPRYTSVKTTVFSWPY